MIFEFRINHLPKTYDDIPIYQELIDELKRDLPRIEMKLPIINEEIALLIRYEIEIDPKVCFFLPIDLIDLFLYSNRFSNNINHYLVFGRIIKFY